MTSDQIIVALIVGAFGLAGVIVTFVSTRGKTRADAKTALDARIDARLSEQLDKAWEKSDQLETKVDELEKKVDAHDRKWGAVGRVLHMIDQQFGTPNLNPSDIALIEDTIPTHWIRR